MQLPGISLRLPPSFTAHSPAIAIETGTSRTRTSTHALTPRTHRSGTYVLVPAITRTLHRSLDVNSAQTLTANHRHAQDLDAEMQLQLVAPLLENGATSSSLHELMAKLTPNQWQTLPCDFQELSAVAFTRILTFASSPASSRRREPRRCSHSHPDARRTCPPRRSGGSSHQSSARAPARPQSSRRRRAERRRFARKVVAGLRP